MSPRFTDNLRLNPLCYGREFALIFNVEQYLELVMRNGVFFLLPLERLIVPPG